MLNKYLDKSGQELIHQYYPATQELQPLTNKPQNFGDSLCLKNLYISQQQDSFYFVFAFEALQNIPTDYRVFFHITTLDDRHKFYNFDFATPSPTSTWKKGDLIICYRAIPALRSDFKYLIGFFVDDHRLGKGLKGRYILN